MNEVETYLRASGQWKVPIETDWLGRAKQGTWWPTYYSQWLDAHPQREGRDPGGWTHDDSYRDWWVTDTPDWDRQWFRAQGVRPPKRFGEKDRTYWKDCGDGLRRKSYR